MTPAEILTEIQRMSFQEQSRIYITLKDLVSRETDARRRQLACAALTLEADYKRDAELTAFTDLDSEDFF